MGARGRWRRLLTAVAALGAVALGPCLNQPRAREAEEEDVATRFGREAIVRYGCGTCHTIPGVPGADGLVAPPLTRFGERAYIAGQLSNTHEHLVEWIMDPQAVEPGTVMPDLGVTEEDARNIAAYLHSDAVEVSQGQ